MNNNSTVVASDLYPLLVEFLQQVQLKKTIKTFKKETAMEEFKSSGENLIDIYNFYLSHKPSNREKSKKKRKRIEEPVIEAVENSIVKKKKKKKHEEIHTEEEKQNSFVTPSDSKKNKKKKKHKEIPTEEEDQNSVISTSDSNKSKKKKNGISKMKPSEEKEKQIEEKEIIEQHTNESIQEKVCPSPTVVSNPASEKKINTPFRRVTDDDKKFLNNERLTDNSFWSKNGDLYGQKANEVLQKVRGKDFRHQKTKKKKGSYRGGPIERGVNSFKFQYSDDE